MKLAQHAPLAKKILMVVIMLIPIFIQGGAALALSQDELDSIYNDTTWYDPNSSDATSCGTTNLSGSDAETQIWNYLRSKNLSPIAAAGLMGNFATETGGTWNPRINSGGDLTDSPKSNSIAYGIAQWLGGRQDTLVQRADDANTIPGTLSLQLDFVWFELSGGYQNTVLKPLQSPSLNTTDRAAEIVFTYYEAPGDTSLPARQQHATDVLIKYGSTEPTDTGTISDTSGCNPGGVSTAPGNCTANGIVYQSEYSQDQLTRIFGDPGTADSHPAIDANLTNVNFLGHSLQVNKLIAPCLQAVASDWQKNNISYKINDIGCYRFDSDNGTSNIGLRSYHTYGAACDINAHTNNFYSNGAARPYNPNCPPVSGVVDSGNCYDMPPNVIKIFAAHGFYWGGNFNSVKDYMHFEFHGINP